MLTTLANPFACGLQKTEGTILTSGSYVLFVYLFEGEKQLTVLF